MSWRKRGDRQPYKHIHPHTHVCVLSSHACIHDACTAYTCMYAHTRTRRTTHAHAYAHNQTKPEHTIVEHISLDELAYVCVMSLRMCVYTHPRSACLYTHTHTICMTYFLCYPTPPPSLIRHSLLHEHQSLPSLSPFLHTCMVTRRSSTLTSLVRKSAPMVALYWLLNFLFTY